MLERIESEDESSSDKSAESPLIRVEFSSANRPEMKKVVPRALDRSFLSPRFESEYAFKEIVKEKSFHDVESIARALNKHFIFTNLQMESRIRVISKMTLIHYDPEKIVFQQGKFGTHFFNIAKGQVEVVVDSKRVNILSKGESFGELALLHDFPRSATIRTLSSVYLWRLDREVFKNETKKIAEKNFAENQKFIEGLSIFSGLTSQQKSCLLESLSEFKFDQNQYIVREGDKGGVCYFIKKGKVKCMKKNQVIGEISEGKYFGENSLLSRAPRTASIVAATEVRCIGLSKENLVLALGNQLEKIIMDNIKLKVLEKSESLRELDKDIKMKIVEMSEICSFEPETVVIGQGDLIGEKILMVIEGQLKSSEGPWKGLYDCIGDNEMVTSQESVCEKEIRAETLVKLAFLTKAQFNEIIGTKSEHFTFVDIARIKEVSILKGIHHTKLLGLTEKFSLSLYESGDEIVTQNSPGDLFFMIKSGTVSVVKNGVVLRVIAKYDYFGERSLIFDELRTASVVANEKVSCWILKRNDFFSSLNETALKRIMKRIRMQDNRLELRDLEFVRILGRGGYGVVFLVCDKSSSNYYALKVISKEKVQKYELSQYVDSEIKILLCLDNDFILKLVHNFEDSQFIYLLTEFVKGEDLFCILRVIKNLSEDQSRFYFACLLVIVEYLHDRDVIYRDFKPENVIVDEEGYPRLIDFGIAKMTKDRTFTVLGTPHYIAPEIILGKGYSQHADYWSLGVMLYEFTFNRLPFGDSESNPFSIYQAILDRQLSFVSMKCVSKNLKGLISQLLHVNPSARNGGAVHKLKAHPWLASVQWEGIVGKSADPPYVPKLEPDGSGDKGVDLLQLIMQEVANEDF